MAHPAALNDDFNISTAESTNGARSSPSRSGSASTADVPFAYVSDDPFEHDVQKRVPSVDKARDVLGFECTTSLDEMLDEVVPWIIQAVEDGLI